MEDKVNRKPFLLNLAVVILLIGGCALGPSPVDFEKQSEIKSLSDEVAGESETLAMVQKDLFHRLEKPVSREIHLKPVMPEYDPLDNQKVSFSMVDEELQLILYSLAQSVGMNMIINPAVNIDKDKVTLNFQNVSASTVLKEVLESFDLYYEVDRNVIRIKPYNERIFRLNFLDSNIDMRFDVGGDVLGEGETDTPAGLSGSFKLSGRGSKKGNAYDLVEEMIKNMVSENGKYALNRLSGTLYVKDTPAVIQSVSRLVNNLREMLARQILIEARIIEVALNDQYKFGIDWSAVYDKSSSATRYDSVAWALGTGLVMRHVDGLWTLDATVDALRTFGDAKVVSNPTLRVKHSRPALISVGTSFTYKKSVTTTLRDRDTFTDEFSEVEVSTVFDGLILGVVPFVEENGHITLLINPITSSIDPDSLNPKPVTGRSVESIALPEVRIKEISTTVGINDGDIIILGGLIDKRSQTITKGVPLLSAIPGLGYLFRHDEVIDQARELVIVLTVSMIR